MRSFFLAALFLFSAHSIAICQQKDAVEHANRLSFRAGYLIGYRSDGNFPLVLDYERLIARNFSLGGSAGIQLVSDHGAKYYLGQVSVRKYFFGDYRRLSVGTHVFDRYDNSIVDETAAGVTFQLGYLWQWKYLFLSFEGGLGPAFVKRADSTHYSFRPDFVDGTLNLGVRF